jgi:hypothetical protein
MRFDGLSLNDDGYDQLNKSLQKVTNSEDLVESEADRIHRLFGALVMPSISPFTFQNLAF